MQLIRLLPLFLAVAVFAADRPQKEFPLWTGKAPGQKGDTPRDIPTLTPFWAANPTGAAIVICPGGGYGGLAPHEGKSYADWLAAKGIHCFVLKYRLGSAGYRHPVMLQDVSRAIRTVRYRAKDWEIDPQRIGVMGSSAGGHLTSTIVAHFDAGDVDAEDLIDRVSSRPDAAILCYPVISLGKFTHQGSKRNLLGTNPSPALVKLLSNELQVRQDSPPCFIWHTWEDKAVPVENSLLFASALKRQGVRVDLHVYEAGRHGLGLGGGRAGGKLHPWTSDLVFWLKQRKFLNKEPAR
jgi:acetyl esterase/lipase